MQLIQITSTPLEYKLRITNAELRVAETENAKKAEDAKKTEIAETARASFYSALSELVGKPAVSGEVDNTKTQSEQEHFSDGYEEDDIALLIANEDEEIEIPEKPSMAEQFQSRIREEFLSRLPVSDYVETRQFAATDSQNTANADSPIKQAKAISAYQKALEYEFQPGEVKMEILTKPSVEISYIGGFMYVPPESNPDYEEPEYVNVA